MPRDITFNSDIFWKDLYSRFPAKYRAADEKVNLALKRFIQVASDGGFKYAIDEITGLLSLKDPMNTNENVLPVLFEQYGFDLFHGIPEPFLRYFLPKLSESWAKKGSIDVIEFVVSSLSGIKTTSNVYFDENDDTQLEVRLEMNYSVTDYFPDPNQFKRIIENFIPFYVDSTLIYVWVFYETQKLFPKEYYFDEIHENTIEQSFIPYDTGTRIVPMLNVLDLELNDQFILNGIKTFTVVPDVLIDLVRFNDHDTSTLHGVTSVFDELSVYDGNEVQKVIGDETYNKEHLVIADEYLYLPTLNVEDYDLNRFFMLNKSEEDFGDLSISTAFFADAFKYATVIESGVLPQNTSQDEFMGLFTNTSESELNDGYLLVPDVTDVIYYHSTGVSVDAYPSLYKYVGT